MTAPGSPGPRCGTTTPSPRSTLTVHSGGFHDAWGLHLHGGAHAQLAARWPRCLPRHVRRARLPSLAEARAIAHLRAWDDRIIAPRFGFRSAAHYDAEASVAPRLSRLVCPALLVAATDDPMVAAGTVLPALREEPPLLDVRWIAGGHIGFPASLDLGLGGQTGLEPQILRWLRRAASL